MEMDKAYLIKAKEVIVCVAADTDPFQLSGVSLIFFLSFKERICQA